VFGVRINDELETADRSRAPRSMARIESIRQQL
jgi:hypothetical protein